MLDSKYKKLAAIWIGLFLLGGTVVLLNETVFEDPSDKVADFSYDELVSEEPVESDPQAEVSEPKDTQWANFASVFAEDCEVVRDGVIQPKGTGFKSIMEALEPVQVLPDDSQVYIVQCMRYAYQTSQLLVLYDGDTYIPLQMVSLNEDGTESKDYPVVGLQYIPTSDSFRSYAKGRGIGDCATGAEYKLIDQNMVLQTFTADWECDGELDMKTVYEVSV